MYRQIFQGDEFAVKTVYSTDGDTRNIDGRGIITAKIDLHPKYLNPSVKGRVRLTECQTLPLVDCHKPPTLYIPDIPTETLDRFRNPGFNAKIKKILDGKFPDYLIDACLAANVDFSGYNMFSIRYDMGETLGPAFIEFAQGLESVLTH